ncbi:MAG: GerMN domain-containing protein [Pseudomonadota bacterium]|nr:GerMN domain-containing protein [Pseudomonadota bacterium]
MAKVSKTKKKSRAVSKKRSPRPSRRSPLLPAFKFLIIVSGLIVILYYLYTGSSPSTIRPRSEPTVKPGNSVSQPENRPVERKKKHQLPLHQPTPPSSRTTLQYYRLEQNFSQVTMLKKSFPQTLNRQQKAAEIIRLLTLSGSHDLAPLPHQTKLLTTTFSAPLITIDLSNDLVKGAVNFGGQDEMLAISCLTNSLLANFPEFSALQILIEGKKRETLAGHIDISQPLRYQPTKIE